MAEEVKIGAKGALNAGSKVDINTKKFTHEGKINGDIVNLKSDIITIEKAATIRAVNNLDIIENSEGAGTFTNLGQISTEAKDGQLIIKMRQKIENTGRIIGQNSTLDTSKLDNSGMIQGFNSLIIDNHGNKLQEFKNTGTLKSNSTVAINATNINLDEGTYLVKGLDLAMDNRLSLNRALSFNGGFKARAAGLDIGGQGSISANQLVELDLAGNTAVIQGQITSAQNKVVMKDVADLKLTGEKSRVQADGDVEITMATPVSAAAAAAAMPTALPSTPPTRDVNIEGTITSMQGAVTVTQANKVTVTKKGKESLGIASDQQMKIDAKELDNSGNISSKNGIVDLQLAANLTNSGDIGGTKGVKIHTATDGKLENINNSGEMKSLAGNVDMKAKQLTNSKLIESEGGQTILVVDTLNNQAKGQIVSAKGMKLTGTKLTNQGWMDSNGEMELDYKEEIDNNNGGNIRSAGGMNLKAPTIRTASGKISSAKNMNLTARTIDNNGTPNPVSKLQKSFTNITRGVGVVFQTTYNNSETSKGSIAAGGDIDIQLEGGNLEVGLENSLSAAGDLNIHGSGSLVMPKVRTQKLAKVYEEREEQKSTRNVWKQLKGEGKSVTVIEFRRYEWNNTLNNTEHGGKIVANNVDIRGVNVQTPVHQYALRTNPGQNTSSLNNILNHVVTPTSVGATSATPNYTQSRDEARTLVEQLMKMERPRINKSPAPSSTSAAAAAAAVGSQAMAAAAAPVNNPIAEEEMPKETRQGPTGAPATANLGAESLPDLLSKLGNFKPASDGATPAAGPAPILPEADIELPSTDPIAMSHSEEELAEPVMPEVAKPSTQFLYESRPEYVDLKNFLGSEYLFKLLTTHDKYDDTYIKRLGDAAVESALVKEQIKQATGQHFLYTQQELGHYTYGNFQQAQMARLMDSAALAAQKLNLKVGTPLTAAQQAQLTDSIIWMEETVVNGQTVLYPKLYAFKRPSYELPLDSRGGAMIAANTITINNDRTDNSILLYGKDNVEINTGKFTNTQGAVISDGRTSIISQDDLVNDRGVLKGRRLDLASTQGSVKNLARIDTFTHHHRTGHSTSYIDSGRGTIEAGVEGFSIQAAQKFENRGSTLTSQGAASIDATQGIDFTAIKYEHGNHHVTSRSKNIEHHVEHSRSKVDIAGDLTLTSAQGDLVSVGTQAHIGGNLKTDVQNETHTGVKDSHYKETYSKSKGSFGRSKSSHSVNYAEEVQRDTWEAEGRVDHKAAESFKLTGAVVSGDQGVKIDAPNQVYEPMSESSHSQHTTNKRGMLKSSAYGGTKETTKQAPSMLASSEGSVDLGESESINRTNLQVIAKDGFHAQTKELIEAAATETTRETNFREKSGFGVGGIIGSKSSERSQTANIPTVNKDYVAGDYNLNATDAASLQGSQKEAGGKMTVELPDGAKVEPAYGNITTHEEESKASIGAWFVKGKNTVGVEAGLKTEEHSTDTSRGIAAVPQFTSGDDMKVHYAGSGTEVGVQLQSGGKLEHSADGDLDRQAARTLTQGESSYEKNFGGLSATVTWMPGKAHDDLKEAVKAGERLNHAFNKDLSSEAKLANVVNTLEATKQAIKSLGDAAKGPVKGGFDATIRHQHSTVSYSQEEVTVPSDVAVDTALLQVGGKLTEEGAQDHSDAKFTKIAKELESTSAEVHSSTRASHKNISVSAPVFGSGVTPSYGQSRGKSDNVEHVQGHTTAPIVEVVTEADATFKGASVIADELTTRVGGDLRVESVQDTVRGRQIGWNVAVNIDDQRIPQGEGNEQPSYNDWLSSPSAAAKSTFTGADIRQQGIKELSGNYQRTHGAWTEEPSMLLGRRSADVEVEGKTTLVGGAIGSEAEGGLSFETGSLETQDLKDSYKSVGLGGTLERKSGEGGGGTLKPTDLNVSKTEKEGTTKATVTTGEVKVDGVTVTELPSVNRNITSIQEVTKDESYEVKMHLDISMTGAVRDTVEAISAAVQEIRENPMFSPQMKQEAEIMAPMVEVAMQDPEFLAMDKQQQVEVLYEAKEKVKSVKNAIEVENHYKAKDKEAPKEEVMAALAGATPYVGADDKLFFTETSIKISSDKEAATVKQEVVPVSAVTNDKEEMKERLTLYQTFKLTLMVTPQAIIAEYTGQGLIKAEEMVGHVGLEVKAVAKNIVKGISPELYEGMRQVERTVRSARNEVGNFVGQVTGDALSAADAAATASAPRAYEAAKEVGKATLETVDNIQSNMGPGQKKALQYLTMLVGPKGGKTTINAVKIENGAATAAKVESKLPDAKVLAAEKSFDNHIQDAVTSMFELAPATQVDPGWKAKIFGKGQKTKTPGHAKMSTRIAILCAQHPEVEAVYLDKWLKTSTGGKVAKGLERKRPDVVVRLKNGETWQFEVRSKTDRTRVLKGRMIMNRDGLPVEMQGDTKVIDIRGLDYNAYRSKGK
jgi:adhesin HecA-like repeat protein